MTSHLFYWYEDDICWSHDVVRVFNLTPKRIYKYGTWGLIYKAVKHSQALIGRSFWITTLYSRVYIATKTTVYIATKTSSVDPSPVRGARLYVLPFYLFLVE